MKLIICLFALLILGSCVPSQEIVATVVRDCSGTYVRRNNVDFKVCNSVNLTRFENGQRIIAKYKEVYECADTTTKCIWYHPYAQTVKIKKPTLDEE
jgi:hypothetical protein